ncbi:hypothetical protein [Burkholderia ubonensis]|uniref:hypothetical protein n=1 Tax=Burkholderia ubonensis TaxID=101571 RepID=UPI0007598707|nr:hypothetical protein [Burkholderia ubonensis]KWC67483.1 hypothetical protein WL53_06105 [Burkholderia ubonensis]
MIDSETYQRLLDTHGRRVANRAAAESTAREDRELGWFYASYGREDILPENERCRTGMLTRYDPLGFVQLYADHPCDERSPVYRLTNGLSAQWFEWLVSINRVWGIWAIRFISLSLLLHDRGESIEAIESIARDEGELVAEDGARFCAWYAGWRGWVAFADGLTESEIAALRLTFEWLRGMHHEHPRHPEPGSQEAEMMCPSELPETDQEAK